MKRTQRLNWFFPEEAEIHLRKHNQLITCNILIRYSLTAMMICILNNQNMYRYNSMLLQSDSTIYVRYERKLEPGLAKSQCVNVPSISKSVSASCLNLDFVDHLMFPMGWGGCYLLVWHCFLGSILAFSFKFQNLNITFSTKTSNKSTYIGYINSLFSTLITNNYWLYVFIYMNKF